VREDLDHLSSENDSRRAREKRTLSEVPFSPSRTRTVALKASLSFDLPIAAERTGEWSRLGARTTN
jgi:hypothetical protein